MPNRTTPSAPEPKPASAVDDAELVGRIARHDQAAFEVLMRRHNGKLFRAARAILKDDAEAEDALQDAYLDAYRHINDFRGGARLSTWLTRIVINQALMRLRKRRTGTGRTVSIDEDIETDDDSIPREIADWSPNPEQLYDQAELKDILSRNIQGLPASFRTVFVLRDVEGLSTEETAEALQLSVPAVKSRLLRARLQLRERLNRYFKKKKDGANKP